MSNATITIGDGPPMPVTITGFHDPRKEAQAVLDEMRDLSSPDAYMCMPAADRNKQLKRLHSDYVDLLREGYPEIELGFTGKGEAYALLGPSRADGFVAYFKIERRGGESKQHARKRAALRAYDLLLGQIGATAKEHPYRWAE